MQQHDYPVYISTFDVTAGQTLRSSGILKYQQEAGEQQLEQFSLGYNELYARSLAFVVTNTTIVINRMPRYTDRITLQTWNRGIRGAKYFRGYNWICDGEPLIEAASAFAVVDTQKHLLQRPDVIGGDMEQYFSRQNAAGTPSKLRLVGQLYECGARQVFPSLLDGNGHLNNSYYADFVTDCLDKQERERLHTLRIDFVREAVEGELITLHRTDEDSSGAVFFDGTHSNGLCFRAKCELVK